MRKMKPAWMSQFALSDQSGIVTGYWKSSVMISAQREITSTAMRTILT